MTLKTPILQIDGDRPMKYVATKGGGGAFLVWNWGKRDFETGGAEDWYDWCFSSEVRQVNRATFNAHVAALRR